MHSWGFNVKIYHHSDLPKSKCKKFRLSQNMLFLDFSKHLPLSKNPLGANAMGGAWHNISQLDSLPLRLPYLEREPLSLRASALNYLSYVPINSVSTYIFVTKRLGENKASVLFPSYVCTQPFLYVLLIPR